MLIYINDNIMKGRVKNFVKAYARNIFETQGGQLSLRQKNNLENVYTMERFIEMNGTLIRRDNDSCSP
jgi:hypothetical protein